MTTPAGDERAALATLFDDVGPDAPTLCEGWTTRDLAAHLVLRERRPDAAAGIVIPAFARHTATVQARIATRPYSDLVDDVRSGPPVVSPTRIDAVDRLVNSVEFFVHHEDVRRAREGWTARDLDPELIGDLHAALRRMAKVLARRAPVGVELQPTDGPATIVAKAAEPSVTVRGPVGELVLWVYGRRDVALVELDGSPDAVDRLRDAPLGL
jgi:uncharacterized protein (TIGR03085 family)